MKMSCFLAAVTILGILPARAQDAESGYQIARRWCSPCHQIGRNAVPNVVSPAFVQIARMPSTTTISLTVFLSTPHHQMPNYKLTPQEIADVSAFILSLRDS
jgi:mono/diheme cytochrome c family protein